jgi:hypothetical protein
MKKPHKVVCGFSDNDFVEEESFLDKLKPGDKLIDVRIGLNKLANATVISNFPKAKTLYMQLDRIIPFNKKLIVDYNSQYLELCSKKDE